MNEAIPPRQQEILALARAQGRVSVESLAARFEVTPQTIRKDLNELCDRRLMSRVHGGAIVASGVENIASSAMRSRRLALSRREGERASKTSRP